MYGNQKMKTLVLLDYLLKNSDEQHPVTMKQIIEHLDAQGISAERKSIYSDIRLLEDYGVDIITNKGKGNFNYYIGSRDFELAELKLLVDAVQSARFITEKKSTELIKKLESFTSKYQAGKLQRNVYVTGRAKTINESIYYNVDALYDAMHNNKIIEFKYLEWNLDKKLVPKNDGVAYRVSPWQLIWNDGNYYLVAFDEMSETIRHYRVDKMSNIVETDMERNGKEKLAHENPAKYNSMNFSMFGGEEVRVTLEADNKLIGVVIDRFGNDVPVMKTGGDTFHAHVNVTVSDQFFGWVAGLSGKMHIIEPADVKTQYKEFLLKLVEGADF